MTDLSALRLKDIVILQITTMEAEKQKSQKSMSSKENLEDFLSQFNLKIIKTS